MQKLTTRRKASRSVAPSAMLNALSPATSNLALQQSTWWVLSRGIIVQWLGRQANFFQDKALCIKKKTLLLLLWLLETPLVRCSVVLPDLNHYCRKPRKKVSKSLLTAWRGSAQAATTGNTETCFFTTLMRTAKGIFATVPTASLWSMKIQLCSTTESLKRGRCWLKRLSVLRPPWASMEFILTTGKPGLKFWRWTGRSWIEKMLTVNQHTPKNKRWTARSWFETKTTGIGTPIEWKPTRTHSLLSCANVFGASTQNSW